jgi:hypothetical protein
MLVRSTLLGLLKEWRILSSLEISLSDIVYDSERFAGEKSSGKGAGKGPARRAIPTGQTVRDLRLQRNKNVRDLDPPLWYLGVCEAGFRV